jgi:hypothetical protein
VKRAALPARHEPHWESLQGTKGAAVGLFKSPDWREGAPCIWRLRVRLPGRYSWEVLGVVADGKRQAGGREGVLSVLDYAHALERAKERAEAIRRVDRVGAPGARVLPDEEQQLYLTKDVAAYTVADALADFKRHLEAEGKSSAKSVASEAASILPALGERPVAKLTLADLDARGATPWPRRPRCDALGRARPGLASQSISPTPRQGRVDDRATSELMQRFYRKMFRKRLSPAAAPHAAQASMWADGWRQPADWAGFVFEGDWQVR